MSVRVSFAGREIMRVPEDLIAPLQQLCDLVGAPAYSRDRAGEELVVASLLAGRAIGLAAWPGDGIAAEIVGSLREHLARAGALVRAAPGDVCIAFRSRPPDASARTGIRVLHGLRGFLAHRRLAAVLAASIGGTRSGARPALSPSAGRWLGRWAGWQRPSALVEIPAGKGGSGFREACVRGTYQGLLLHFALHQPAYEPAAVPAHPQTVPPLLAPVVAPAVEDDSTEQLSAETEPERPTPTPPPPIRIMRRARRENLQHFLLPPGADPSRISETHPRAAADAAGPAAVEGHPVPVYAARRPPVPPSTGTRGFREHERQPWFTGRWSDQNLVRRPAGRHPGG